jgi:hypothetical protein
MHCNSFIIKYLNLPIKNYGFTGKYVPEEAVLDMKANFKLPAENDDNFDYIEYIELPREKAVSLVEQYVILYTKSCGFHLKNSVCIDFLL